MEWMTLKREMLSFFTQDGIVTYLKTDFKFYGAFFDFVLAMFTRMEMLFVGLKYRKCIVFHPYLDSNVVTHVFAQTKVAVLGFDVLPDNPTCDIPHTHLEWIVCQGGFIHEFLDVHDWIQDARNGKAPYIGAWLHSMES